MKRTMVVCVVICACVNLTGCSPLESLFAPAPTSAPQGVSVNPHRLMPDFTLTNTESQPTRLSDMRGKAVLIFFGYTHCPDICPFSMAEFYAVKQELGDLGNEVQFVMISVDGTRDTPEVMRYYVKPFDSTFIGLTGPESDVTRIGVNYGVHFEKQKPTDAQGAYTVAHTTYTYLLDAQGRWRIVFPFGTPVESMAADIKHVVLQAD